MLKLLMCGVFMSPVAFFMTQTDSGDLYANDSATFAAVSEDAVMSQVKGCETVTIPVFFHEAYLEHHSSEFLNMAFTEMGSCEVERVNIQHLIANDTLTSDTDTKANLSWEDRDAEIKAILLAYVTDETTPMTSKTTIVGDAPLLESSINIQLHLTGADPRDS